MQLPNGNLAIVDIRKLQGYCLSLVHPRGKHKARVFASLGVRASDADELRAVLLRAAKSEMAVSGPSGPYGERYIIDFDWARPSRTIRLRSAWIIIAGETVPRLTSCYVL